MTKRWVRHLLEAVGHCWEWQSPAQRIAAQVRPPEDRDDCWEVWVYPAVQEIVGGPQDGQAVWGGFHFDVSRWLERFDAEQVGVCTGTPHDPPELVLEGRFRGRAVLLHVCLEPPEEAEATEVIDLTGPGGAVIRDKG
jgi:hypothetical protein